MCWTITPRSSLSRCQLSFQAVSILSWLSDGLFPSVTGEISRCEFTLKHKSLFMHEVKILLSGEPAIPNVFKHLITITSPAGCSRQVYSLSRIFTWLLLSHWDLAILSRLRCRFILLSLTSSDDILRDMSGAACPPHLSWSVV